MSTKKDKKKGKKGGKAPSNPLITARSPTQMVVGAPPPKKMTNEFVKVVHGHVNPFTNDALGVKVHDGNTSNTYTFRTMSRSGAMTDGTNRYYGWTIGPNLVAERNNWTTPADQTSAWSGRASVNNSSYTLIAANSAGVRLVSWGVRFYCTSPYTLTDGYLMIATIRGDPGTPTNATMLDPSAWLSYNIIPIKDLDHVWIAKRADSGIADNFSPAADTYSSASVAGWTTCVAMYAPSASAANIAVAGIGFQVEVVKNFEIVPLVATLSAGIATPAAPDSQIVRGVVDRVHTAIDHVGPTDAHQRTLMDKVRSVATAVASDGLDFFAPKISRALFGRGRALGMLSNGLREVD